MIFVYITDVSRHNIYHTEIAHAFPDYCMKPEEDTFSQPSKSLTNKQHPRRWKTAGMAYSLLLVTTTTFRYH